MSEEKEYPFDVYVCTKRIGLHAGLAIAGGFVSSCIFILFFLLLMVIPAEKHSSMTPAFISGFAVVPFICFIYSVFMLKCVVKISLSTDGIILEGLISKTNIPWTKVAKLKRNKEQLIFNSKKIDVLVLCDENDRQLGRITGMIENFPELVDRIEELAEKGRGEPVFNENEELQRKRNEQRKNMRRVKYLFGFFTFMGLVMSIWGGYEFYYKKQLEKHGIEIQAKIVKHYIYNITPRLEYSFVADTGNTLTNDVMVERKVWDQLKGSDQILVSYLPGKPEWNCLVTGEIPGTEPKMMLLVGIACTILFGVVFGIAVAGIDLDTKNGKINIVRAGEVSLEFENTDQAPAIQQRNIPTVAQKQTSLGGKLPKGILAFAILNVVFGGGILLLNLGRCVWSLLDFDPMLLVVGVFNIVFALTMIISAYGLFKLCNWGRILAVCSASGMILLDLVSFALRIINYIAEAGQFACEMKMMYNAAFIAALLFALLGLIYPVVLAVILSRRPARERFLNNG